MRWIAAVGLGVLCVSMCAGPYVPAAAAEAAERLHVFATIPPAAAFVEAVGAERVAVEVLLTPGQSPATYSPSPRQVARLARADLCVRVGVPFERALFREAAARFPELKIIDLRAGIELRRMQGDHDHDHDDEGDGDEDRELKAEQSPARARPTVRVSTVAGGAMTPFAVAHDSHEDEDAHGDVHEHGDEEGDGEAEAEHGLDPHTWLSPRLAQKQCLTIRDALIELDPAGAEDYRRNCAAYIEELERARVRIAEALEPLRGRTMLVYHPAYGYFADEFGLEQVAIEREGKRPGPRRLAAIIEQARERDAHVIFVQPQFDQTAARRIARAIDGAVVPLDPLARDYLGNLWAMARAIERGLKD